MARRECRRHARKEPAAGSEPSDAVRWGVFKTILVPLDGSPFAERALPVAVALAAETGGDLALIRVVPLVPPAEDEPGVISYLDEHRIAVAQEYIAQAAARTHRDPLPSAEAYIAADIVAGILGRALDVGADLIVISSHGRSWPSPSALGSVATKLTRESPVPLLVLGPRIAVSTAEITADTTQSR